MDDVVQEFLAESHENLDQLDRDLVALERDPSDPDLLRRVFRTIHTIKGTCGFLGFSKLESVTHAGESLLSRLRDGELVLTPKIAEGLLRLVDAVRQMLSGIAKTGTDGDGDYSALTGMLVSLQRPDPAEAGSEAAVIGEDLPSSAVAPERAVGGPAPAGAAARCGDLSDANVRVDVDLLDRLMRLTGELVLARNQILQVTAARRDPSLAAAAQRLSVVTSDLQEGVMKTRMQPIGLFGSKLPRLVRDLAAAHGKVVRLEMEGLETELDRGILEAIRDPLTHIVRNAVDHGIEAPQVRSAAGKPPEGRIALRAFHEGGQVNIEVEDDGAGIEPERLRQEAVRRGLLTPERAARLGDTEALNLIFLQGLSTASKVTTLSGRGVGMDVVKTNVERLGGTVEVRSSPGAGTSLRLKIPLTLAIIPALIVACGPERYALPQSSVLELVHLEGAEARDAIESFNGAPVFRLRGALLPVIDLAAELGVSAGRADRALRLVVAKADGRPFGLVVDAIHDTEEIVVKPLGRHFRRIETFAGATILGDGSVALILDVVGFAQRARVAAGPSGQAEAAPASLSPGAEEEQATLLVFETTGARRMALPLSSVARLEEFPPSSAERAGDRDVIQYRGSLLPLVRISVLMGLRADPPAEDGAPLRVLVLGEGERLVGLVVDRIHDIVSEPLRLQWRGDRRGVVGTAVVQGRVTEILEVEWLRQVAKGDRIGAGAVMAGKG